MLIEKKWGSPLVCDDGVTIVKAVKLKDPVENLGAQILRDAAVQTSERVGDGTTTSTLLAHAMFAEGLRNVVVGVSAIGITRGMDRGCEAAVRALQAISRPVKDKSDTVHVATVSAHNDAEIGALVADAVDKVGTEGVVEVEEARSTETTLEVVEGMQFDKGYLSPYFVTDPEAMEAALENPLVLLVDRKITAMADVLPLLDQVVKSGRSILLIAENVEGEALATLVVKVRGSLAAAVVKAPGIGDRRRAMLDDVAILTGARVISDDLGIKLENVSLDDLGSAERVVIDKDTTTIIGGRGKPGAVEQRCDEIRRQIKDTTSDYDKDKLEERLAKLSGGVAVIRVGAVSEAGLKHLKEAFDDAINSTKAAAAEGIVPGGGTALLRAIEAVEAEERSCEGAERDRRSRRAHGARSAHPSDCAECRDRRRSVVEKVRAATGFFGFDARTKTFGDLDERGIIDPTKVVRIALENAVGVAGTLLLAGATLVEIEEPADRTSTSAGFE